MLTDTITTAWVRQARRDCVRVLLARAATTYVVTEVGSIRLDTVTRFRALRLIAEVLDGHARLAAQTLNPRA